MFMEVLTLILFLCWITKLTVGEDKVLAQAHCQINPGSGFSKTLKGNINLTEYMKPDNSSYLSVRVDLSGFNTSNDIKEHGFHVHTNGNISDRCSAAGPHYNPDNAVHGGPLDEIGKRHVGDFGNLLEGSSNLGTVNSNYAFNHTSLIGSYSILRRTLVVHGDKDDLGKGNALSSNMTGNSGDRLGCCVITQIYSANVSTSRSFLPTVSISTIFIFISLLK